MTIVWDERKNTINQAKHGIAFEEAALIFDDPLFVSFPERYVNGEERWMALGIVEGITVLAIAHTVTEDNNEEIIRIISARKASRSERKFYEEADR